MKYDDDKIPCAIVCPLAPTKKTHIDVTAGLVWGCRKHVRHKDDVRGDCSDYREVGGWPFRGGRKLRRTRPQGLQI